MYCDQNVFFLRDNLFIEVLEKNDNAKKQVPLQ